MQNPKNKNFYVVTFKVKPNKPKSQITSKDDTMYYADLAAPSMENKANDELLALISKEFCVPKSSLEFLSGKKSKLKRIKVYS